MFFRKLYVKFLLNFFANELCIIIKITRFFSVYYQSVTGNNLNFLNHPHCVFIIDN